MDTNGVVGMVYFQRDGASYDEGVLAYRTLHPDGSSSTDSVTTGVRMAKAVLLYDAGNNPHLFVARSSDTAQFIDHYYRFHGNQWLRDTIAQFGADTGKFIYEMSADHGPDGSFHLLVLKTRSNPDSADYWDAWINAHLIYLTNVTGCWQQQWVYSYDMAYTYDTYIYSSIRQDIKIDDDGHAHVVFGEQLQLSGYDDPSRLRYATNTSGSWVVETAFTYFDGRRDDAGWFPSLCLDNNGIPYVTCMYVARVYTRSARYCKLFLLRRAGPDNWYAEVIADHDDGYYGHDGRVYTGGHSHLVFDASNTPHIVFSDIASFHWDYNHLHVGNIRYAVLVNGEWQMTTIYRQPIPTGRYDATEMQGMCLLISKDTDRKYVIGQELVVTAPYEYHSNLVELTWTGSPVDVVEYPDSAFPAEIHVSQNYPNPFNRDTIIQFELPYQVNLTATVHNPRGQIVRRLIENELPPGIHSVHWDGTDSQGHKVSAGIYFLRLQAGPVVETRKMILLK